MTDQSKLQVKTIDELKQQPEEYRTACEKLVISHARSEEHTSELQSH